MKNMKRIASLLLALVMVLCLTTTAFAADTAGKITITNANDGETYTAYKIFDLSYNDDKTAYSYSIAADSPWYDDIKDFTGLKFTLVATGEKYIVEKVDGFDAAAFAAHLGTKVTGKTGASVVASNGTAVFDNLELGYYLIDTTLGTLCFLDSTNPEVSIAEKHILPTIEKTVKEDSTNTYGETNTAQIGDTIEFKTVIKAQPGAEKYVLHDTMDKGLTLLPDTITVENLTKDTDYTVTTADLSDGCTFEISFAQAYLDTIKVQDTVITVTYSAILNEKALISPSTNDNTTKLTYGDESVTEIETTKTETLMFNVVKTDSANNLLDGAQFVLYDAEVGGNMIALVDANTADEVFRIATEAEKTAEGFVSAVIVTQEGCAGIRGLDANTTYYLEEIVAPNGYNKLDKRVAVEMKDTNLEATGTDGVWNGDGVHVINQAGTELPSTGGMGTTLFYTIGGLMMLAAVVLLVTKKRMAA